MIRTLRFTAIISGIAALAVIVLVVYPMVAGRDIDENVKAFLQSPGVVEQFKAKGSMAGKSGEERSPLIEEAERFGLYLDPPVKVDNTPPRPRTVDTARVEKRPQPTTVSAKFKLIMTSYSSSRPELSRAMIDQPGKGVYWVKEKSKVGYLEIEKIKDGAVVVKDASSSYEVEVPKKEQFSLLRSKQVSAGGQNLPDSSSEFPADTINAEASAGTSVLESESANRPRLPDNPNLQKLREVIQKNKPSNPKPGDQQKRMEELMAAIEAMRMSAQESEKIKELGQELQEEIEKEPPQRPTPPTRPSPIRRPATKSDK